MFSAAQSANSPSVRHDAADIVELLVLQFHIELNWIQLSRRIAKARRYRIYPGQAGGIYALEMGLLYGPHHEAQPWKMDSSLDCWACLELLGLDDHLFW